MKGWKDAFTMRQRTRSARTQTAGIRLACAASFKGRNAQEQTIGKEHERRTTGERCDLQLPIVHSATCDTKARTQLFL